MQNRKYLTIKEIGKVLDVPHKSVEQWIRDERLKSYRVGKNHRIRPEDLIEYLKNLGNPPFAMTQFKKDIENFLSQKYEKQKC